MSQAYKIFINETQLVIAGKDYIPVNEAYIEQEIDFEKDIPGFINKVFDGKYSSEILVRVDSVDDMVGKVRKKLVLVVAAGGLVWNLDNELLMIFRRGKGDLPKGKLDKGENLETAAIREVMEETGTTGLKITQKARMMDYIYRNKSGVFLKEIHWYEMHTDNKTALVPQTKEGITKAEWVPKTEIAEKMENTYASVRELMGEFEDSLRNRKKIVG